jgi:hypothetical protein
MPAQIMSVRVIGFLNLRFIRLPVEFNRFGY